MLYSLTGNIVHIDTAMLALSCSGVAFACHASANTLRDVHLNKEVTLFTHLNVREDALDLFAFGTQAELRCFRQLVNVTGVGPKAALAVLSACTPEQLGLHIAAGDIRAITQAQGVGKKLAERIVLELKDKLAVPVGVAGAPPGNSHFSAPTPDNEALAALLALGYQQTEAMLALRGIDDSATTQEKIRLALRMLAG
ncbi:MAG: Holliday junction branch migration protein RuvA [Oscillospiraceae bacterium]|nr:Holliday junction branch migration protein RuvA [Oscillospiraceae bacterium]